MEKIAEALEVLRLLSLVWGSRLNEGDRAAPIQHQCEVWWELDFSRCSAEGAAWTKGRVSQYKKHPWGEMGESWKSSKTEKGKKVFYNLWAML